MNSAVQVCWEKAARYLEVEERYWYCTSERYVIDPKPAVDLVDENTIMVCAILGSTYTGEYEDVQVRLVFILWSGYLLCYFVDCLGNDVDSQRSAGGEEQGGWTGCSYSRRCGLRWLCGAVRKPSAPLGLQGSSRLLYQRFGPQMYVLLTRTSLSNFL